MGAVTTFVFPATHLPWVICRLRSPRHLTVVVITIRHAIQHLFLKQLDSFGPSYTPSHGCSYNSSTRHLTSIITTTRNLRNGQWSSLSYHPNRNGLCWLQLVQRPIVTIDISTIRIAVSKLADHYLVFSNCEYELLLHHQIDRSFHFERLLFKILLSPHSSNSPPDFTTSEDPI